MKKWVKYYQTERFGYCPDCGKEVIKNIQGDVLDHKCDRLLGRFLAFKKKKDEKRKQKDIVPPKT
jgi:hypothetical protein